VEFEAGEHEQHWPAGATQYGAQRSARPRDGGSPVPSPTRNRFDCGSEGNCWAVRHQQRFALRHSRLWAACRLHPAGEPVRRLGYG